MSEAAVDPQQHQPDVKTPHGDVEGEKAPSNPPSFNRNYTAGGHEAHDLVPSIPSYHRKFANATPMGMFSFSSTIVLLSIYNLGARGVSVPNGAVIFALGLGGGTQLVAGMLEFASGNSYGATVFTSFSMFWFGWAMLYIPFFGLTGTWNSSPGEYTATGAGALEIGTAFGVFFITWFTVACTLTIASIRSSVVTLTWITSFDLTLLLLAISFWKPDNTKILTAAGSFGCITSFFGFYVGQAGLLTKETGYFTLPMGSLRRKQQ
ncbi:hypothetical protein RQP46_010157 [Phenoliferia psychrophenolica]